MNKELLKSLGLNDEQIEAVLNGYKGYVPPERFNEVNEAKKNAEASIAERDKQLTELKKAVGDNDALKSQIEQLQADNKSAKEKYEADLKALKIDNAVNNALTGAGAKNLKAVKALLDMEKITLEGDEVKGIDEQVKGLLKGADTSFLFNVQQTPKGGLKPAEGAGGGTQKAVKDMNYSERVAFLAAGGKLE